MSTSIAEHDSYLVENWDTETLIDFLKEQNLKLDDDDLGILRKQKIDGQAFLELTKEELLASPYNFPGGPAIKLAKEIKALKEKPKRAFSTYRSLKEVLAKYGIDGTIRQFPPATYKLEDDDEDPRGTSLHHGREATSSGYGFIQCESALQVNKKNRKRKSGEAFGEDLDYIYGIFTTASEWYFILYASDGISSTSKDPLDIRFSESALKEGRKRFANFGARDMFRMYEQYSDIPSQSTTILSCGHVFTGRALLFTKPGACPFPDCGKTVDIVVNPNSTRRGSQSSQSSGTSALSNLMGEKFNLISSTIPEDPMEDVEGALIKETERRCPTCPAEDLEKRSNESSAENTSRKKVKSSGRDNSLILKRLIQELSTDTSEDYISLQPDSSASSTNDPIDFLKLYKDILDAEDASKKTAQDLILRYFHFSRKQIPESVSESLLRKTKERAQKIYDMFSELGVDKIKRIKTFTVSTLTHVSQEDIDYVLATLSSS
ncbi:hypothetical protein RhiirA5_421203 [Rhizophagus irregularis]|uniref:SAM domain-containing protein n=1 Tax=Rhizophagus irregularis TaxID=588596 RepID=A0A2N0PEE1_9GLOM|nr:hypothetical protein RhiirA5_421203 [Rhizophagus irregularis]